MAKRDARNLRIADDTSKKRCWNCKFFIRDENLSTAKYEKGDAILK